MSKKVAVVAIGGNSLIKDENHKTVEDQYLAAKETTRHIADMIEAGWEVAIGHGNGPQVGFILRRSEIAAKVEGMHEIPLDVCGADSQGAIGYALQQTLQNELFRRKIKKAVATVVTQVLVDKNDPAFKSPTKPIGSFMDEAEAKRRQKEMGWSVVEDSGRGWRRVVASPLPKEVVELEFSGSTYQGWDCSGHGGRRGYPGHRCRGGRVCRDRSRHRQRLCIQFAGAPDQS